MDKSFETDIQILQNILKVQYDMIAIADNHEDPKEVVRNKSEMDLMEFYNLKIIALTNGLTGKTKKELPTFIDKETNKMLTDEFGRCYSTISKQEILRNALRFCSDDMVFEIKEVLRVFIEKCDNNN